MLFRVRSMSHVRINDTLGLYPEIAKSGAERHWNWAVIAFKISCIK